MDLTARSGAPVRQSPLVARPPRPRRKQREQARALRKLVRQTESLAAELPGGSPEQPIDVTSAAVVEGKARATPCIQCGGDLDLRGDRATSTGRGILRELALVCRRCHAPRTLWFRVAPAAVN
jgi:hypothetical protein